MPPDAESACGIPISACRTRNAECGMRNPQRGMWNAESATRNAECGIRTELCGTVQSAAESAVRNAESARGDVEFRIPQKYEPGFNPGSYFQHSQSALHPHSIHFEKVKIFNIFLPTVSD